MCGPQCMVNRNRGKHCLDSPHQNGSSEEWCKVAYKIISLYLSQWRYSLCFMEPKDSLTYSQALAICPYHVVPHAHQSQSPWFDCCNNIWWRVKSYSSSLCNFLHPPVTSFPSDPNIFLSTLLSLTLSLCSALDVRDQVSHPYKVIDKIIVLYLSYIL